LNALRVIAQAALFWFSGLRGFMVVMFRLTCSPPAHRRRFRDANPEEINALTLDGMREAVMAQLHAGNLEVRWAPNTRASAMPAAQRGMEKGLIDVRHGNRPEGVYESMCSAGVSDCGMLGLWLFSSLCWAAPACRKMCLVSFISHVHARPRTACAPLGSASARKHDSHLCASASWATWTGRRWTRWCCGTWAPSRRGRRRRRRSRGP